MAKPQINIAVFTGSRAEYGLMRHLISEINAHPSLNLQLLVSGSHVSHMHGNTIEEIKADNHVPSAIIPLSLDNIPKASIAELTAEALAGVSKAIQYLKSHLLVVLGDRYESFAAASAGHFERIPICHLHGGETTEGAIDDRLRHAISQLASIHFCAASRYQERLLKMGHAAKNVHNTGPMVLDALATHKPIKKQIFTRKTGYQFGGINLLATFHPETLKQDYGLEQLRHLLCCLEEQSLNILFTMPNADQGGQLITNEIKQFHQNHSERTWLIPSLGQDLYLSALYLFDGVIGNSSSGIIEAPLMKVPTLNVGTRQGGRLRFGDVLEAGESERSIKEGWNRLINKIKAPKSDFNNNLIPATIQMPSSIIIPKIIDFMSSNTKF